MDSSTRRKRQSCISKFFAPSAGGSQGKEKHEILHGRSGTKETPLTTQVIVLSDDDSSPPHEYLAHDPLVERKESSSESIQAAGTNNEQKSQHVDECPDSNDKDGRPRQEEEESKWMRGSAATDSVQVSIAVSTDEDNTTSTIQKLRAQLNGHDDVKVGKDCETVQDDDDNVKPTPPPCMAPPPTSSSHHVNPFAQFAAPGSDNDGAYQRPLWKRPRPEPAVPAAKRSKATTTNNSWVRMADLPAVEQERIVQKWHSLIVRAPTTESQQDDDMEPERFQVLVAARLHARCQEGPVRQAMQKLHALLVPTHGPKLDAALLARIDPEIWMEAVRNLHYYASKARHIQKAAITIMEQFQGGVPERESDLQTLTGIGPVLADLLAFVNTRQVHERRRQARNSS